MAERLRLVGGIELITRDQKTGQQIGFSDHGGHFLGHADGIIHGLLQAPATAHIWEHKCVNEAKFRKLNQLANELGEKNALEAWDKTYYTQAQLYMHYSGLKRHYLTCATPGTRDVTSVRTEYDGEFSEQVANRAATIIFSDKPLHKLSDNPVFWLCKWCEHAEICHGPKVAEVNCRTCIHSTPERDGGWSCARFGTALSIEAQRNGGKCPQHRLIPDLIPFAEVVDADEKQNTIRYSTEKGEFINGEGGYTSAEIKAAGLSIVNQVVDAVKKPSAAGQKPESQDQQDQPQPWSNAANAGSSWLTTLETAQASGSAQ